MALALVLDERVALGHGAQSDALLEVVHLVEVLAPAAVHHRQQHTALELVQPLLAELLLALLVGELRVGEDLLLELARLEVLLAAHLVDDVLRREGDGIGRAQRAPQLLEVDVLAGLAGGVRVDGAADDLLDEALDVRIELLALEDARTLLVELPALLGQDVVVLQDVLADLGVAGLDRVLRALDRTGDHPPRQRDRLVHAAAGEQRLGGARVEQAHQVVLEREVEAGLPRVALSAGAAAQLVVDAARLVPLGAQHVQPAELDDLVVLLGHGLLRALDLLVPGGLVGLRVLLGVQAALLELGMRHELDVAAEHDVGAAAGHVGRDGDRALGAGHRDDRRLTGVVLGVEHLVGDALGGQQLREVLGLLHAGGAHEDGLALLVPLDDVLDDRVELRLLGAIDAVGLVHALHRSVRGDRDHAELVGVHELGGLGLGRAGHARELLVELEVVLEGDRGEGLVLRLDLHPLLRLDGLVHALVVAAAGEDAPGVLVDDHHLAVEDHVVLVALEQLLGLDGVVQEADQRGVQRLVEVVDAEVVLDLVDPRLEHADGALLLVDLVVAVAAQVGDDLRELAEPLVRVPGAGAGDDQRGAGLVDEDRVDLVDDREEVAALDPLLRREGHVVAQVVEAELVVRAVGDVGGVLLAALRRGHPGLDHAGGQAQGAEDTAHQVALVAGEIVVDRHDVHALAGERVEIGGEGRDEGLALTGLHLGDAAAVQGGAAHDLHVVGALAEGAVRGLAHGRERLDLDVVEGLAVLEALLEVVGLGAQLVIAELREDVLRLAHALRDGFEPADLPAFAGAQDLVEEVGHSCAPVDGGDVPMDG